MDPKGSGQEANPPRLRFDTVDDALSYAAELAKQGNDWLTANDRQFLKRYLQGEAELVLTGLFAGYGEKYSFIFSVIQDGRTGVTHLGHGVLHHHNTSGADVHVDNSPVCVGVPCFIQGPKEIIPSLVRLQLYTEIKNLLWDIPGTLFPFGLIFNFPQGVSEWEIGSSSLWHILEYGGGVSRVVQRGPDIAENVENPFFKFRWNRLEEFDLKNVPTKFRVWLTNYSCKVACQVSLDFPFEILEVAFARRDALTRASEGVA